MVKLKELLSLRVRIAIKSVIVKSGNVKLFYFFMIVTVNYGILAASYTGSPFNMIVQSGGT